jgi:hypothetical protein
MGLLGAAAAAVLVPAQAVVQEASPRAVLGRVTSTAVAIVGLGQIASMALAGPVVERMGLPRLLFAGAIWAAVGAVLSTIRSPDGP